MPENPSPAWAHSLPSALWLMAPFDLLASLAMDAYLPALPQMPEALGVSAQRVQLTLSAYLAVLGLGQLLFGPLSDRVGRRPVLLGGAALFSLASFALAATRDGDVFVALRVLQGLGASAALVATFATVRDAYADRPEGRTIYAVLGAMLACVPALGPPAGALLAMHSGWRAIFVALGLLGTLALAQAWARWRETRVPGPADPLAGLAVLASRAFWAHTLGFSTAMGAFFVFFSTAPRALIGRAGMSPLTFSLLFASVALAMIAATRLAGRRVERWGVRGGLARGLAVLLAGTVLHAAGAATGAPPSFATFIVPMWVTAVGIVLVVSVAANGALAGFGHVAGAAVALYYGIQSLVVGTFGTLATFVLPGDSAWPLVGYGVTMAGLAFAALAWERRAPVAPG